MAVLLPMTADNVDNTLIFSVALAPYIIKSPDWAIWERFVALARNEFSCWRYETVNKGVQQRDPGPNGCCVFCVCTRSGEEKKREKKRVLFSILRRRSLSTYNMCVYIPAPSSSVFLHFFRLLPSSSFLPSFLSVFSFCPFMHCF